MRLLILERDHALYAALLMAADPSLKVVAGDDPLQLIDAASECSIWLGQPDLVAQMLRQGVHPVWGSRPGRASRRCWPPTCRRTTA